MAIHMSMRLAWHNDGWNGHICKKPCENVYCIGQHSYPGESLQKTGIWNLKKSMQVRPVRCIHVRLHVD